MKQLTIIFKSGRAIRVIAELPALLQKIRKAAEGKAEHHFMEFNDALIAVDDIDAIVPSENILP